MSSSAFAHDARERGFEVVVVSSDFTIQATVFGEESRPFLSLAFTADSADVEEERRGSPAGPRAKNAP